MKKNLFLLFSIYFFVLQPLIIGVLRGQANFFWLGAINLVVILLIGILSNTAEQHSEETRTQEKSPAKETKVSFHEQLRTASAGHKKKPTMVLPLIISLAVALLLFFIFQDTGSAQEVMSLFALILGFIIFLSLWLIQRRHNSKSFWKLIGTRIYLVALFVSLVGVTIDYIQIHRTYQSSFQDYIAQNFLGQERIPIDGYIFTGEGTILGSGLTDTSLSQDVSSDLISGSTTASDILQTTGTSIDVTYTDDIPPTNNTTPSLTIGNQTLMDAVIYLIQKYDLPLVTKQDMTFTYVTTKNPYYAERRTAYANKMIGKTTNPSKYIVCESYIVMKGIAEKWNVQYTSTNVLTKFRAEAEKRDALNGCVKGKIVTDKTL